MATDPHPVALDSFATQSPPTTRLYVHGVSVHLPDFYDTNPTPPMVSELGSFSETHQSSQSSHITSLLPNCALNFISSFRFFRPHPRIVLSLSTLPILISYHVSSGALRKKLAKLLSIRTDYRSDWEDVFGFSPDCTNPSCPAIQLLDARPLSIVRRETTQPPTPGSPVPTTNGTPAPTMTNPGSLFTSSLTTSPPSGGAMTGQPGTLGANRAPKNLGSTPEMGAC
ncbi:hypothetical protein PtA15_4A669 [Puccinia triticina]|uniref:Uncharacterized protein n=1 Tax=Puccinia triticina TaxID=208348 RepID=A0ABY7CIB1_9BASI|nr:uncharacterized protein PtA15_4A669 [Puccinia triticina]WAQ84217.1 hypothetical protein PtA15_4A669 [Puccinia triticina]WAR55044.1 hypothetical protein PtB15_4B663 [Puccinia triticina]